MPPKIAVNIITGPLGVGKTTAVSALLGQKPSDEHWAVLVNEFGAVGIDGALLGTAAEGAGKGDGVTVREISGGCMCCAGAAVLTPTIAQLARRSRPQRLLVEPSGLGHPGGLIDAITGKFLAPSLELRATICVVDARAIAAHDKELLEADFFQNMISVADVIVASKVDLATEEEIEVFLRWGNSLYPPKAVVTTELTAALLDTPTSFQPPPDLPEGSARDGGALHLKSDYAAYAPGSESAPELKEAAGEPLVARRPRLRTSSREGRNAAGWSFSAGDVFDPKVLRPVLAALLGAPGVLRVKGIFRLGKEWYALRLAPGAVECDDCLPLHDSGGMVLCSLAYRKDSRIELIVQQEGAPAVECSGDHDTTGDLATHARRAGMACDWQALELVLVECLRRA